MVNSECRELTYSNEITTIFNIKFSEAETTITIKVVTFK